MNERFSGLKEKGRMIGEILTRKKPIETDILDVVTHIGEYRGRTVRVVGDAAYQNEQTLPKASDLMLNVIPPREETTIRYRLYDGGYGIRNSSIVFDKKVVHVVGHPPSEQERYEGRVVVTGRVKMETVKESDDRDDSLPFLGKVKAPRPYIKASEVRSL